MYYKVVKLSGRIPIIKIKDNLFVSIQSDIDDQTALNLQTNLLKKINKTQVGGVVLELSSVDMVDSFLGRIISDIAKMSSTMNAQTVVVGIQPAVAITLVELGLNLEGIHTALDLEDGIELLKKLKRKKNKSNDKQKHSKKDRNKD